MSVFYLYHFEQQKITQGSQWISSLHVQPASFVFCIFYNFLRKIVFACKWKMVFVRIWYNMCVCVCVYIYIYIYIYRQYTHISYTHTKGFVCFWCYLCNTCIHSYTHTHNIQRGCSLMYLTEQSSSSEGVLTCVSHTREQSVCRHKYRCLLLPCRSLASWVVCACVYTYVDTYAYIKCVLHTRDCHRTVTNTASDHNVFFWHFMFT